MAWTVGAHVFICKNYNAKRQRGEGRQWHLDQSRMARRWHLPETRRVLTLIWTEQHGAQTRSRAGLETSRPEEWLAGGSSYSWWKHQTLSSNPHQLTMGRFALGPGSTLHGSEQKCDSIGISWNIPWRWDLEKGCTPFILLKYWSALLHCSVSNELFTAEPCLE